MVGRMPRSSLARPLEPLVAISWGIFLVWSAWLAVVWIVGIDRDWLRLPIASADGWEPGVASLVQDVPPPPNADLRRAILLLANHAELAWLVLALIQIHLHVVATNGVNTGRIWLGVALGGAFLLASANRAFGVPFGWLHFTRVLGAQFFGVPLGWVLLWAVLLIGARESVLRLWNRASHFVAATLAAGIVTLTFLNLQPIARVDVRAWWYWHSGTVLQAAPTPWWFWLSIFIAAWGMLALMRERSVVSAAARRSTKPLIVLGLLNLSALAAHLVR